MIKSDLSPDILYEKILKHPAIRSDNQFPSLDVFKSWSLERRTDVISAFSHLNPGIVMESTVGRKIIGFKTVDAGKDLLGLSLKRTIIKWGKALE